MQQRYYRDQFPIFHQHRSGQSLVYFDTAATAQKPSCVLDKLLECYTQYYANVHRGVHPLHERATEELEQSRQVVARFLGARPFDPYEELSEIIFTSGTTMGINLVARAWGAQNLHQGDEILLTPLEHHANIVPWQRIAAERRASVRYLPLTHDGQIDLNQLDRYITSRTKLVGITGMSNVLGTVPPVEPIVHAAHAMGAVVLLDAAQSVAHQPIDVQALDVDFLVFSGHKLYGPSGIGVLYGKLELLDRMEPFLSGGNMIEFVDWQHSTYKRPPFRFEAGTLPIAEAIALRAAIEFVEQIGWEQITQHEFILLRECHQLLESTPGVTVYGPPVDQKGAIVSFTVDGIPAHDLATALAEYGIALRASHHCAMLLHRWLNVDATARISFGIYNTTDELNILNDALRATQKFFRRRRPE